MDVRPATTDDRDVIRDLYREFAEEWPPPAYVALEHEVAEVEDAVDGGRAFIAEEAGEPLGFALAWPKRDGVGYLSDLYVRPAARGRRVGTELVRAAADALRTNGVTHMTLNVDVGNAPARAVYARWGFAEESVNLVVALDDLEVRLAEQPRGESFGSVHVQSDDVPAVERAVRRFIPLLRGRSEGTVVAPPRGGWIGVYDELCDREPAHLRRLARELSDGLGVVTLAIGVEQDAVAHYVLYERGRPVDEYMSVPEHFGPRPSGEVVALGANATLVQRLTGADRGAVKAAAVQGARVDELSPPTQIIEAIGRALGIEGAGHGYAGAGAIGGAVRF